MHLQKLIKTYFDVEKSKNFSRAKKRELLKGLEILSKDFPKSEIKEIAAEEMVKTKNGMYKLYCQCVALTGKLIV